MGSEDNKQLHYPLGGSVAARWLACHGYYHFAQQCGEEPTSEYAAEGTVAHALAHALILEDESMLPGGIGDTVKQEGHDITISDDMYEAVMEYVAYVEKLRTLYRLHPSQIFIEQTVCIPGLIFEGVQQGGALDCGIVVPYTKVIIIDYKHGRGVRVSVENNPQLKYYAVGFWNTLPQDVKDEISEIELVVIQPRCPGGGITTWTMTPNDLADFHLEMLNTLPLIKPGAPLVAGDHCKFCPAQAICPALTSKIHADAGVRFADVELPAIVAKDQLPQPEHMSIQEIARALHVRKLADDWFNAMNSYAVKQAETDPVFREHLEALGFELVARRSNRKWGDKEKVLDWISRRAKPEEWLKQPEPLSVAQMEKQKAIPGELQCLIEKPDNGYTLAPIHGKRVSVRDVTFDTI